ncbi:hypothetical protein [Thermoactinospora rubra]|uniref:hypothetical protein n=1 Tax=Thermoactinospora rubra TaxID=1088767 RepID=UPI000A10A0E3|nr:hypothetical protein [Thermoactinospora rubra]
MSQTVATGVIALALLLAVVALIVAIRDRAMGMVLLIGFALLEIAVLVQAGLAVAALAGGHEPKEKVTFVAYLAGTALIPPAGVFLALAERSRWGSAILVVAGFAVAVMTGRLLQLWAGA